MSDTRLGARAAAVREGAGLFALPGRGVIEVTGSERVRWLDGMVSGDVRALEAAGPGAGCYALLLTPQGRLVADLHVLLDGEALWLELEREVLAVVMERLERFIIADDVSLTEHSDAWLRFALEGPAARRVLESAAGGAELPNLADDAWCAVAVDGVAVRVAAFSFTGGEALQLFVPAGEEPRVLAALTGAEGVVEGDASLLELLRVEAGTPWQGRELDESVLPAEARVERAVSTTKGCYTGQEVVARMRSRDRQRSQLVGLRLAGAQLPAPGDALSADGRRVGELTSVVASPRFGAIALGYLRRELAVPGTRVAYLGGEARVAALPFAEAEDAPEPA